MLSDSGLPKRFWAEALSTATYLRNRSPTTSLPKITPFEAWTGNKPNLMHLKVFGCQAYAHIPGWPILLVYLVQWWFFLIVWVLLGGYLDDRSSYRLILVQGARWFLSFPLPKTWRFCCRIHVPLLDHIACILFVSRPYPSIQQLLVLGSSFPLSSQPARAPQISNVDLWFIQAKLWTFCNLTLSLYYLL